MEEASIVFCLIGKRWLTAQDPETGDRRLSIPADWVRHEIETALQKEITIVPILIDDARMPMTKAFQTLPSVAALINHQNMSLRRKDWSSDFLKILNLLLDHGFLLRAGEIESGENASPRERKKYFEPVRRYRKRVSGLYDRWDLSAVGTSPSGTGSKPVDVRLDNIYLPLRLAKTYNPEIENIGTVF